MTSEMTQAVDLEQGIRGSRDRTGTTSSDGSGWAGSLPAEAAEERLRKSLSVADQPPEAFVAAMIPTLFPESTPISVVQDFAAIVSEFHPP